MMGKLETESASRPPVEPAGSASAPTTAEALPVRLMYHGTSLKAWSQIRQRGLALGSGHNWPKGGHLAQFSRGRVFLDAFPYGAQWYADVAAKSDKSSPVILTVNVTGLLLKVDPNAGIGSYYSPEAIPPERIREYQVDPPSADWGVQLRMMLAE